MSVPAPDLEKLQAALSREIQAFDGACGFFALDLESGSTVADAEHEPLEIASAFKLLPLIAAYRRWDAGQLDLGQTITVGRNDRVRGSGLLRELEDDVATSLGNLLRLMIIVSDNVATVHVLRTLGVEAVNEVAADLGLERTVFHPPGQGQRAHATSTPRELVLAMRAVMEDRAASAASCGEMRQMLARQFYLDQLPRYLPVNQYADELGQEPLVTVRNKTGFSAGIRSDVASIETPGHLPVLMSAITNWAQPDAGAKSLLSEPACCLHGTLARIVIDTLRPGLATLPYTPYSERRW
jgi:beta-lactamase class A